jgi:hypothetical protein
VSITLVSVSQGYVTGPQPAIPMPYSTQPGDMLVVYFATNRACGVIETSGLPLGTVEAVNYGTLCDCLLVRQLTGAEWGLQAYSLADVPSQDKLFAVPGPYLVMAFRGCQASQPDGHGYLTSGGHQMIFPNAIMGAAGDLILLLGCAATVNMALDSDTVAGFTHIATARDANRGANAFSATQAGAGGSGSHAGVNNCGTNLITHTMGLYAAPPPSPPPGPPPPPPPPPSHRGQSQLILT